MFFKIIKISVFLLCFLFLFTNGILNLPEGSKCEVVGKSYNRSGECVKYHTCLTTAIDFHRNRDPEICSFDGDLPIICCPGCDRIPDIRTSYISTAGYLHWETGNKVKDKCDEFSVHMESTSCFGSDPMVSYGRSWGQEEDCDRVSYFYHTAGGGRNADPAEYPHMALLGYGNAERIKWHCGGTLISEKFILTAAHCCISTKEDGPVMYASVGLLRRSEEELDRHDWGEWRERPEWSRLSKLLERQQKQMKQERGEWRRREWRSRDQRGSIQRRLIKKIIKHPNYRPPSIYNDIALLEIDGPVELNRNVIPACLPTPEDHTYENILPVTATGWGTLGYKAELADTLQVVTIKDFGEEQCKRQYSREKFKRHLTFGYDHTLQMCYGSHDKPIDTCEGDSGGPLQINVNCMYKILGVTSSGRSCGVPDQAGLYSRVLHYVPWIVETVWPDDSSSANKRRNWEQQIRRLHGRNPKYTEIVFKSANVPYKSANVTYRSASLSDKSASLSNTSAKMSNKSANVPYESVSLSYESANMSTKSVSLSDKSANVPYESVSLSDESANMSTKSVSLSDKSANVPYKSASLSDKDGNSKSPVRSSTLPLSPTLLPEGPTFDKSDSFPEVYSSKTPIINSKLILMKIQNRVRHLFNISDAINLTSTEQPDPVSNQHRTSDSVPQLPSDSIERAVLDQVFELASEKHLTTEQYVSLSDNVPDISSDGISSDMSTKQYTSLSDNLTGTTSVDVSSNDVSLDQMTEQYVSLSDKIADTISDDILSDLTTEQYVSLSDKVTDTTSDDVLSDLTPEQYVSLSDYVADTPSDNVSSDLTTKLYVSLTDNLTDTPLDGVSSDPTIDQYVSLSDTLTDTTSDNVSSDLTTEQYASLSDNLTDTSLDGVSSHPTTEQYVSLSDNVADTPSGSVISDQTTERYVSLSNNVADTPSDGVSLDLTTEQYVSLDTTSDSVSSDLTTEQYVSLSDNVVDTSSDGVTSDQTTERYVSLSDNMADTSSDGVSSDLTTEQYVSLDTTSDSVSSDLTTEQYVSLSDNVADTSSDGVTSDQTTERYVSLSDNMADTSSDGVSSDLTTEQYVSLDTTSDSVSSDLTTEHYVSLSDNMADTIDSSEKMFNESTCRRNPNISVILLIIFFFIEFA